MKKSKLECAALARAARAAKAQSLHDRFWSKVQIKGADDCWPWIAACTHHGRGTFWLDGRQQPSAKVALIMTGRYEKGMFALHTCDNPNCCNPAHIFPGTHQENMDDMVSKGRQGFGSKNNHSKLTDSQVARIRRLIPADRKPRPEIRKSLREEFGITNTHISNIVYRKTWRHL